MSPIKRALEDSPHFELAPKRLRGGGFDEPDFEEQLFDDDDDADVDAMMAEIPSEILEQAGEAYKSKDHERRWKRKEIPSDLSNGKDLDIQWLDMDVVDGPALLKNPNSGQPIRGQTEGKVPILRCFGVNDEGHSVAAFIHGFTPCKSHVGILIAHAHLVVLFLQIPILLSSLVVQSMKHS